LKAAKRLTPGVSDEWLTLAAVLGDADEARAAFPIALSEAKESPDQLQYQEPALRALVALAGGQPAEVVRLLGQVTYAPRFVRQLMLSSVANVRLGRNEAAIDGLTWLVGPPARLGLDATLPYALHTLATSQEAAGRAGDAERTRARLAELWKNADDDVPLNRR